MNVRIGHFHKASTVENAKYYSAISKKNLLINLQLYSFDLEIKNIKKLCSNITDRTHLTARPTARPTFSEKN